MAGNEKCWLPCHERAFASREDSPGIVPGGKLPSRKMLVLDDSARIRSRIQEENSEYFDFSDFSCEEHKSTYADWGYCPSSRTEQRHLIRLGVLRNLFAVFTDSACRTGRFPSVRGVWAAWGRAVATQSYWDSI